MFWKAGSPWVKQHLHSFETAYRFVVRRVALERMLSKDRHHLCRVMKEYDEYQHSEIAQTMAAAACLKSKNQGFKSAG